MSLYDDDDDGSDDQIEDKMDGSAAMRSRFAFETCIRQIWKVGGHEEVGKGGARGL